MRILFLGLNYAPDAIGIAVYSQGLCEDLAALGHEVQVIVGKPYYPQWRVPEDQRGGWRRERKGGIDITRCPLYVPARPSGAKRILHHLSFALSALFPTLFAAWRFRPDIVITVAPSIIAAPVAVLAGRVAGARSWLHVQDFELEAAFAIGLLDSSSIFARFGRQLERSIISLFDDVSSISPEMCTKLLAMGVPADRVAELRNWAEIENIRPLADPSPYLCEWSISTRHVALYSGNIANKQGIEIVLEAASLLRHRDDLTFVICGQGPNRAALEARSAALGNILFRDLQPVQRLGDLLGMATVHLLPQKAEAADLVLPSKLTNMLASGRPVVATAAEGTGLAREIEGCGLVTPPGDARAFADAIEYLLGDPEVRHVFAMAGRQRAEQVWDRARIVPEFEHRLRRATGTTVRRLPKRR